MNQEKRIKYARMYMNMAKSAAEMSHCKRRKVGCVIVKDNVVLPGWNGMPSGFPNICETSENETNAEVLHAESNAISKLANSTMSGKGASLFCTTVPCLECAKLILQAGIKEVWYIEEYRSDKGEKFLKRCGIDVIKLDM